MIDARCHLHASHSTTTTTNLSPSNTDNRSEIIDEKTLDLRNDQDDNDLIVEESKRVPAGTRVLINDTNRQISGQILKNEINYHYSVDFGDDTYSHDM